MFLFPDEAPLAGDAAPAPLAERMSRTFDEFVGQDDLLAPENRFAKPSSATCCSRSFLGPPGTGKPR
jgi:replication-associated recombination protein RarA